MKRFKIKFNEAIEVDDISVGKKKKAPAGVNVDPNLKGYAYNEEEKPYLVKVHGKGAPGKSSMNIKTRAPSQKDALDKVRKQHPGNSYSIVTEDYETSISLAIEEVELDEALSPKEKEKRLAMIKKAVEKINRQNIEKVKKMAMRDMKAAGMFDDVIDENNESQIKQYRAKLERIDKETEALKDKIVRLRDLRKTATVTDRIDANIKDFKAQIEKLDKEHARYRLAIKHLREEINEEDWSQMGDRSKDWTRRQYQKAVAAGDKERAKDFIDTYGRGVTLKVGHGQDAQGKEIGKFGDKAFKKRIDNIKKTNESMDTLLDMLEETNLDEALSPKEKEKRLVIIKKAVEKLNRANLEKVKKMAMRDMKASGMFDDAMDEHVKGGADSYAALQNARDKVAKTGKAWDSLGQDEKDRLLDKEMVALGYEKKPGNTMYTKVPTDSERKHADKVRADDKAVDKLSEPEKIDYYKNNPSASTAGKDISEKGLIQIQIDRHKATVEKYEKEAMEAYEKMQQAEEDGNDLAAEKYQDEEQAAQDRAAKFERMIDELEDKLSEME